jgi:transcriptional regulator with GAF, ATPase, and Fis domain
VEASQRVLEQIEQSGFMQDFVRYAQNITEPRIVGPRDHIPPFLQVISRIYPSWFGLPISTSRQCIGYFVLGSPTTLHYSREDLNFFLTLFSQIAGHIRHMVVYENEINQLRQKVGERASHGKLIGQSSEMQKIYELIDLVSGSDATVLITGEKGIGRSGHSPAEPS